MQTIKKVIIYTQGRVGMEKLSKRAWAELIELDRRLIRQKFLLRVYGTLLLGFLFALLIDKIK